MSHRRILLNPTTLRRRRGGRKTQTDDVTKWFVRWIQLSLTFLFHLLKLSNVDLSVLSWGENGRNSWLFIEVQTLPDLKTVTVHMMDFKKYFTSRESCFQWISMGFLSFVNTGFDYEIQIKKKKNPHWHHFWHISDYFQNKFISFWML